MLAVIAAATSGLLLPSASVSPPASIMPTRRGVLAGSSAALGWAAFGGAAFADGGDLGEGLKYTVVKSGKSGGTPTRGDLIVIRFKSSVQKTGQVIDDIMANPEGYYFRVGTGVVLPAVEKAVVQMKTGDIWQLTVPPALGFGEKGRSASPGKPRISGDAILDFTLELVAVPGKDDEIIEVNDVDLDAKVTGAGRQ